VDVTGWSVQYNSAGSTTGSWLKTDLSGTIPAGGYYLVQEAQGAGGTVNLPAPDVTGTIAMGATGGKVALLTDGTVLACGGTTPCTSASIKDLVGFGSANTSEGSPTPATSNTTAAIRNGSGCTDTDNNASDFTIGAPAPRNSSSPLGSCSGSPTPTPT